MTKIEFATNLEFDTDIITEVIDVIAKRGSGKTYTAAKLAEGMLIIGAQIVVIDPVGNWYGLRLGSNGKPDGGLDIKILGGRNGDIPLEHTAGPLIAKTIVDTGMSVILDVSMMTKIKQRRFVTQFSASLLEERKRAPAAMHIFWEEAYRFMPQKLAKGSKNEMLEATEELVTMGRNFGIGGTIICQRAAQVSKTVLTQASILVAMNTIGADRKVILDWIDHKGMDKNSKETVKLATLGKGHAFVWWPEEFGITKVKVSKRKTYDASSTPKFGDKKRQNKLKPIDLGALEVSMAETIEKAKSEDPKHLRRKIAELEKKILTLGQAKATTVEVPVLGEATVLAMNHWLADHSDKIGDLAEKLHACRGEIIKAGVKFQADMDKARRGFAAEAKKIPQAPPVKNWGVVVHKSPRRPESSEAPQIKAGALRMLKALAAISPGGMTKRQVAQAAKMKSSSGTFSTYWASLNTNDFIAKGGGGNGPRDRWFITEEGLEYLGDDVPVTPEGPEELLEFWCERLRGKEREILRYLFTLSTVNLSKAEIGREVGLSHTSGTFSTYMSTLTSNGLVDRNDGLYRISEELR